MIMLLYVLCFFVTGRLEWLGKLRQSDPGFFQAVTNIKLTQNAQDVCKGRAFCFQSFGDIIFSLKYKQEPPYQKLQHMLRKALLETD